MRHVGQGQLRRGRRGAALLLAASLAGVVAQGACRQRGPTGPREEPFLERYVALGNSITSGVQSGGLTAELQMSAYPVLLAQRAGARFAFARIADPGCPPPVTSPFFPGSGSFTCALAGSGLPQERFGGNVAVPGARIEDLAILAPGTGFAPLYTLLTGGRSQLQAMRDADPTFVSLWIGNNDALAAALTGSLGAPGSADSTLTPHASFAASLQGVLAAIDAETPRGALVVGVMDPITSVPLLQPGAYFHLYRDPVSGTFFGKAVHASCAPGSPHAGNLVTLEVLRSSVATIHCDPEGYPAGDPRRGAYLLDATEQERIRTRVAQYNATLEAAAAARGWAYVDPNRILRDFRDTKDAAGGYPYVRKCQALAGATTPAQLQQALLASCPVLGLTGTANPFGSLLSLDGVHPSSEAHRVLAGRFAAAINERYGLRLSTAEK